MQSLTENKNILPFSNLNTIILNHESHETSVGPTALHKGPTKPCYDTVDQYQSMARAPRRPPAERCLGAIHKVRHAILGQF